MRVIKKIIFKIRFKIIKIWDGINNRKFTDKYVKLLSKSGMNINGKVDYIASDVYFDGSDYSLIELNDGVVVSKRVTFLTHDFSVRTALVAKGNDFNDCSNVHKTGKIIVGRNCFIGMNAMLLPGTTIGDNCIIGGGCVLKGNIPSNSVVVGNPARVIKKVDEIDLEQSVTNKPIF